MRPTFLIFLALYAALWAQETAVMTVEESVAAALRDNPVIAKARQALVQAEIDKKNAVANFLPKLSATYSATRPRPHSARFHRWCPTQ